MRLAPTLPLALVIALTLPAARAEADGTEPDFQQWAQLLVEGNLDAAARGLRVSLDLQARRMNAPRQRVGTMPDVYAENPNTMVLVRPAVGFQFAPWGSAWVGYAWVPNWFDDADVRAARNVSEHRIYEQLSTAHAFGPLALGTRTRIEQRVRTNGPGSDADDEAAMREDLPDFAHRLRLQLRLALRLREGRPFLLVVWDELFVHLNRTNFATEPGFDQNRAFFGLGYEAEGARVELGYLHQPVRRYADPDQRNHVLSMSAIVSFRPGPPPR